MRRLVLSANRRFLVWNDGEPFFWLGDTAWELFHRATLEESAIYLEKRRRQGFTVVQAVLLAELDGLNVPNAAGHRPFLDNDPLRPNEAYFQHVDRVLDLAAGAGIILALLPTWGDKVQTLPPGKGPVVFDKARAFAYGEWLGRRYADRWNLVWINGGDRPVGGVSEPIWEALASGIKLNDLNHLMTFHPPGGRDGRSSSEWFHAADWLDFNLIQSGHERKHLSNYDIVSADYSLEPVKPCLDGEPRYEDHPVNWKPAELGWFDDYDVRQAAYWAVMAGACGHTYGCHPVWQWLSPERQPVEFARRSWSEAIDLPGANQMRHLRALFESRPMLSRAPDQPMLSSPKTGAAHRRACCGDGYAFVYLPQGGPVEVNLSLFPAERIRAWWFDPRSGVARDAGTRERGNLMEFSPPWSGPCADWVLVIDDAQAGFGPPGQKPEFGRRQPEPVV